MENLKKINIVNIIENSHMYLRSTKFGVCLRLARTKSLGISFVGIHLLIVLILRLERKFTV